MTKKRISHSKFIRATSLYLGPLQWAITDYYQDAAQKNISDVLRGIITLYAENDSQFDPEHFWQHGVMHAYERFTGDEAMQNQVILDALRWLKRSYKWEPKPTQIPAMDDATQTKARLLGIDTKQ